MRADRARRSSFVALGLSALACQASPRPEGAVPPSVAPAAAAPEPAPTAAATPASAPDATFNLAYSKRCGAMAQPRSIRVSAAMPTMTLVDEAGEANRVALAPDRLDALAGALRAAGVERLTSAPRRPAIARECTTTLRVTLAGATHELEDSAQRQIPDEAAWREVQAVLDALWREPL